MTPAPTARPVIVLVPTRGTICAELGRALINNTPGFDLVLRTRDRLAVDVARNALAGDAIARGGRCGVLSARLRSVRVLDR